MNSYLSKTIATFGLLSLTIFAIPASAQTAPNPGTPTVGSPNIVSQAITTIPSASSPFGIDLTACRLSFDWVQYVADQRAGLTSSSPFVDQGCVTQLGLYQNGALQKTTYSSFTTGTPATKAAFGNDQVVAISSQNLNAYNPDGSLKATKTSQNRTNNTDLTQIFSANYKNRIYPGGGPKTGIPKFFSTGTNTFSTDSQGQIYDGGWCKIENGLISVRTNWAGTPINPALYGKNVNDPSTACAMQGKTTVEDRNLKAYQYLFEIKYPTNQECKDWFGFNDGNVAQCQTFFKNRYGGSLNGNTTTGNRILAVYTFYATWDDGGAPVKNGNAITSFNFLGWENPDVNGPRKTDSDSFVRNYDGFSTYVL